MPPAGLDCRGHWYQSFGATGERRLPVSDKQVHATRDEAMRAVTNKEVPMTRRSVPPPKPKSPSLTVGQKRRRIERLQKCIISLEAFEPEKARKRAPAVLALEAAIDKALSSAFGYSTPAYLRYNEAAILDPSPLLANATARSAVAGSVGGPARHDAKAQETRQQFSDNKQRSISLLRKAISTLEEEIADTAPVARAVKELKALPLVPVQGSSKATSKEEKAHAPRAAGLSAAWRRVGRWWRGRN